MIQSWNQWNCQPHWLTATPSLFHALVRQRFSQISNQLVSSIFQSASTPSLYEVASTEHLLLLFPPHYQLLTVHRELPLSSKLKYSEPLVTATSMGCTVLHMFTNQNMTLYIIMKIILKLYNHFTQHLSLCFIILPQPSQNPWFLITKLATKYLV